MAKILKGTSVAQKLTENLIKRVKVLKAHNINPKLEILRVGNKPADIFFYENSIIKRCNQLEIDSKVIVLTNNYKYKYKL